MRSRGHKGGRGRGLEDRRARGRDESALVDRLIDWPVGRRERPIERGPEGARAGGREAETRGLASPSEAMACLTSCEGQARMVFASGWGKQSGSVDRLASWPEGEAETAGNGVRHHHASVLKPCDS